MDLEHGVVNAIRELLEDPFSPQARYPPLVAGGLHDPIPANVGMFDDNRGAVLEPAALQLRAGFAVRREELSAYNPLQQR